MKKQISFVVVGGRHAPLLDLVTSFGAYLLIDEGNHDENWAHRRALEWAAA
ncbi:hypothetical protein [Brenneria corticis]|uniref:hypothetical protein n=1 Tax=Brenneria corticis TaxID=2173106 RepID=UPI00143DAB67|nr:hypothetical protein [Brenneria sp. CFCC 11842]